jgi:hypothetical protein
LAGFCAIYKHFSGFEFFLLSNIVHARPAAGTDYCTCQVLREIVCDRVLPEPKDKICQLSLGFEADHLFTTTDFFFLWERFATPVSLGFVPGLKDLSLGDQSN